MKITFDLKDAQIFLPSGKLMNLKGQLGFTKLLEEMVPKVSKINYELSYTPFTLNEDVALEQKIKVYFNSNEETNMRLNLMSGLTKSILNKISISKVNEETLIKLNASVKKIGADIFSSEKIQLKLKKLQQLRAVNENM